MAIAFWKAMYLEFMNTLLGQLVRFAPPIITLRRHVWNVSYYSQLWFFAPPSFFSLLLSMLGRQMIPGFIKGLKIKGKELTGALRMVGWHHMKQQGSGMFRHGSTTKRCSWSPMANLEEGKGFDFTMSSTTQAEPYIIWNIKAFSLIKLSHLSGESIKPPLPRPF